MFFVIFDADLIFLKLTNPIEPEYHGVNSSFGGLIMDEYIHLNQLKKGESAEVSDISGNTSTVRRLADMGLIGNSTVECVGKSPFGDPSAYLISGAVVAIRFSDSAGITVRRRKT